jgi:hypothetical protein
MARKSLEEMAEDRAMARELTAKAVDLLDTGNAKFKGRGSAGKYNLIVDAKWVGVIEKIDDRNWRYMAVHDDKVQRGSAIAPTRREAALELLSMWIRRTRKCAKVTPPKRDDSKFKRGSGAYTCKVCGKKTRATGDGEEFVELCRRCHDEAGLENEHQDGLHDDKPKQGCPMCGTPKKPKPKGKVASKGGGKRFGQYDTIEAIEAVAVKIAEDVMKADDADEPEEAVSLTFDACVEIGRRIKDERRGLIESGSEPAEAIDSKPMPLHAEVCLMIQEMLDDGRRNGMKYWNRLRRKAVASLKEMS